ncbi:MAG TPA: RodZ domain-containing protein [Solimonas sp.]|nr:RodZ domain-containing protein [Solimonas sp.]
MNAETPAPQDAAAPAEQAAPPSTPGPMIRAARERAHLSLDELAGQTKLARHTLEALERDDFSALLEPVYVRGYYRKCAKVLGLPEAALIDLYQNRVTPRTPGTPSKLRLASGTELGSASRLPIAMAILLVIAAIVVCGFLWFARGKPEPLPASVAARAEAITPEPTPAAPGPVEPELPAAPDAGSVLETPAPAPVTTAPAQAAPAGSAAPAEHKPAPPPAAGGASGTLALSFTASSWVRIDDAAGKTLLNGLMRAGDRQEVSGATPLSVFLGNAPGVTAEFQGKPVDFGAFKRDNQTARFTLPLGAP